MTTTIQPNTLATGVQSWQLDPTHSTVEFAVKHLMIATVKGRFGDVSAVLDGEFDNPESFRLEVTIATDSIETGQAQRDAHLRSPDFFDTMKWPAITFVGKKIEGDVNGEFTLYGDITIRDVTREIKLEVTNEGSVKDPWGNVRVGFSAKGKLDRSKFGLTYNQLLEAGGLTIGDEIRISVDAEFTAVANAVTAAA
jgi:polyisoprenoid-binding protein YceI